MESLDARCAEIMNRISMTIYSFAEAFIIINNEDKCYEVMNSNDYWRNILGKTGTLKDLYYIYFTKKIESEEVEHKNSYQTFINEDFFKLDRYQGHVFIKVGEERAKKGLLLLKIGEYQSVLIISTISLEEQSDNNEIKKINTLQETYLFSMIVNLKDNTCINPSVSEVSKSRMDFMQINYLDWRNKISVMFTETDRELFFRVTNPKHVINTLEEKNNFHIEVKMMNIDGKYIWVRLKFTRMKDFSRNNPCFVYTVQNIDEEMQQLLAQESIIRQVKAQNESLQEADKEKTLFFSNMSHEIRTPINAIVGMNEVILRETDNDVIRCYSEKIKTASDYLLSIVNDILDFSKIEAGKMELVQVEYNPRRMIYDIGTLIKAKADEKNLKYKVEVKGTLPAKLYGDEIRIKQVLINLLTNAVKYTEQGGISLLIECLNDNLQCKMKFFVKDTGIGIKEDDLVRLFNEYERLDTTRNRRIEGTGLGMSIVKGILAKMNSKLEVESVYEEGSTFAFEIYQKIVDVEASKNIADVCDTMNNENRTYTNIDNKNVIASVKGYRDYCDYTGKKILIVDDKDLNLIVAEGLLKPYKATVYTVDSGKKCLEFLQNEKVDIIFMDHMMPEQDGVETMNIIKKEKPEYNKIPIIALTGNTGSNVKQKYINMGFTDYMEKPLLPDRLDSILEAYL